MCDAFLDHILHVLVVGEGMGLCGAYEKVLFLFSSHYYPELIYGGRSCRGG